MKPGTLCIVFAMFMQLCTLASTAQEFIIASDSENLIVCAGQAKGCTAARAGSKEFADIIRKISGKEIKIVNSVTLDRAKRGGVIFIGESPITRELGVKLAQETFESGKSIFRIVVREGNLFLLGVDDIRPVYWPTGRQGTLYAVYAFLEKFGGARWFWPGKTGEYLPKKESIKAPLMDESEMPFFSVRNFLAPNKGKDAEIFWQWANRNRFCSDYIISIGHSFPRYVNRGADFKEHPEWFSMYLGHGKELARHPFTHDGDVGQLCTSNSELIAHMVNHIAKIAESEKGKNTSGLIRTISITPNDGYRFCVCPACRALDIPDKAKYERWGAEGNISNRMWTFANEIGRQLKLRNSPALLGMCAYTFYRTPPEHIAKIEDNIIVGLATPLEGALPERRKKVFEFLGEWSRKSKNILFRGYAYGFTPRTENMLADILEFKKAGILGYRAEFTRNFSLKAPTYYLLSRMLWNPDINHQEVLGEFYRLAFGRAAQHMRNYYEILEEAGKNLEDDGLYHLRNLYLLLPVFTPELFAKLKTELDAAEKIAENKDTAERIAWVKTGWNFMYTYIDFLKGLCNLKASGFGFTWLDKYPAGIMITDPEKLRQEISRVYKLCQDTEKIIGENDLNFAIIGQRDLETIKRLRADWHKEIKSLHDDFVLSSTPRITLSPKWKFWKDPKEEGEKKQVHSNSYDDSEWASIMSNAPWEFQGHADYDGIAWYRQKIAIPSKNGFPTVKLSVGAADESAWVYVNGQLCGQNIFHPKDNPNSWKDPFTVDITKAVRFDQENLIVIKVEDRNGVGGIYKSCSIFYEKSGGADASKNDLLNGIGSFEDGIKGWSLYSRDDFKISSHNTLTPMHSLESGGKSMRSIGTKIPSIPPDSTLSLSLEYKFSGKDAAPDSYILAARLVFLNGGEEQKKYRRWLIIKEGNRGSELKNGYDQVASLIKSPPLESSGDLRIFLPLDGTYCLDKIKLTLLP